MSRRTGPGLSRERVLEAGLRLVDREGVGALTMRRLGRELGVEAMSLYGYISSKRDLLEGVVDRVYREMPPLPDHDDDRWQDCLRRTASQFREVLLRHPNTVNLVAGRPVLNEASLGLVEMALAELRRGGLDLVRASQVVTVVVAFTVGHVTSEVGDVGSPGHDDEVDPDVDPVRFPHVAEQRALGPLDWDDSFGLGLDLVVAGLEQLFESALATR